MRRTTKLAALALAGTLLGACGTAATSGTQIGSAPGQSAPEQDADAPSDAPEADAPSDAPDQGDDSGTDDQPATDGDLTDFRVWAEGQELAMERDGHVTILATLPDEGESVFRTASVRPGGTALDFTVAVVTAAEGMYDLRWLQVVEGVPSELEVFGEAYNLTQDDAAVYGDRAPTLVWAPDGASLAWLEPGEDGATLRTIGWAHGPGTSEPADDNAAFGLEAVPADAHATSWESTGAATSVLTAVTEAGATYEIALERQGDGALALTGTNAA